MSGSRNLRNLEIGFAACFFIDPFGSVHSVRDLPTVGFSKPLKIKHVVQHLHRVRTLNLTGARVRQQSKEQTRFLKKASGMHNCSIDSYHLTTYQAFPIEQQHFWGCKISCVPIIFPAFFGQWQEAQETRPERGETLRKKGNRDVTT